MKKKGFTLVEMLAVIALLGILVLLVLPRVLDYFEKSKKMILIDEAKELYKAATEKYAEERMVGNKITEISNEDGKNINTISTEGEDINYTIHLDEDGIVTAMKVNNSKYCISGIGDFLDNYTVDQVVELSDTSECKLSDLIDKELVTLNLYVNSKDKPLVREHSPKKLYLRINNGWYYSDRKDATNVTQIETVPYKKNYYFDGFYYNDTNKIIGYDGKILTDTNDTNRVFTSAEQLTSEAFAKFEKKYYIVRYNGNTNTSGSMEDTKVLYEESKKLTKNAFLKTGYNFIGWVDEQGITYTDEQDLPIITDDNHDEIDKTYFKFEEDKVLGNNEDNIKTFSAKWEPKKFTITFNTTGGKELSSTDKTKIVTYDSEYGTLPTAYKPGYSFAGWYTSETGGEQIDTSTIVKILDNTTYYAHWGNCPEGYYCPGDNQKYICPVGTYSKANASSCTKCEAGSYQDKEGQSSCVKCVAGSYQDSVGQTVCKACGNGKTTSSTGQSSCNATCSNSSYATGWKTATWNSNNTLTNSCVISNCDSRYALRDNTCKDVTAPTCSVSKSNTGSAAGVTVTIGCSDAASGCESSTQTISNAKSNGSVTIKDKAGNTSTCSYSVSSYDCSYTVAQTCTGSYWADCSYYSTEYRTGYQTCYNYNCYSYSCGGYTYCGWASCGCNCYHSNTCTSCSNDAYTCSYSYPVSVYHSCGYTANYDYDCSYTQAQTCYR